jgi:DNA topoisomerase-1
MLFDGFLKVYEEGRDDVAEDEDDKRLPTGACRRSPRGDAKLVKAAATSPQWRGSEQHFTQPPPRYTEATLVKRMEELGIGRPSTYASIVDHDPGSRLRPQGQGAAVPRGQGADGDGFLVNYFRRYLGYDFTATLEGELDDDLGRRQADYKDVLARFWRDFSAAVGETSELRITDVLEKINEALEPHLFPPNAKMAPTRGLPELRQRATCILRTARSGGAFIGCSNYPECRYTRPFGPPGRRRGGRAGPDRQDAGRRSRRRSDQPARPGRFGPMSSLAR